MRSELPEPESSKKADVDVFVHEYRLLDVGEQITFDDGTSLIILDAQNNGKIWIGKGGQGIVYLAKYKDEQVAFKWYTHPSFFASNKVFFDNLQYLSKKSTQPRFKNYLIPKKISQPEKNGQFGYVMNLIDKGNLTELKDILSRKYEFSSLKTLVTVCHNICIELNKLHKIGLVFCDLNGGGIYVNRETGDIIIGDCDNIMRQKDSPRPIGADGYRAPELYSPNNVCTESSDLHSLAVILFRLLVGMDPYLGKKFNGDEPQQSIYSTEAVFVFDPKDASNRPKIDEYEISWNKIDPDVKQLLLKSLAYGIHDPSERTPAMELMGSFESWEIGLDEYEYQEHEDDDPLNGIMTPPPVDSRIQYILFVVDSSPGMSGKNMNSVNMALKDTIDYFKEYSAGDVQVKYKIGVIQYSKTAHWHPAYSPTDVEEIEFVPLEVDGEVSLIHKACMLLDNSLEFGNLYHRDFNYKKAVIMLITRGGSARSQYSEYVKMLQLNPRFKSASVISIGIENKSKSDSFLSQTLIEFAKNDIKHVIVYDDLGGNLGKLISELAATLSTLTTAGERDTELARIIRKFIRG